MGISLEYDQNLAKSRWEECQSAYDVLWRRMQEDWGFFHGVGQWEDDVGAANREKQGRPCLVLNQLAPYVKRRWPTTFARRALPFVLHPLIRKADIDTAEVLSGIIRNIEVQSGAQTAYVTACGKCGWCELAVAGLYGLRRRRIFWPEIFIDRVLVLQVFTLTLHLKAGWFLTLVCLYS